ncbi:hypothetical protein LX36DRAFT_686410 [Colletotrichum falcatum]|nr:hypothetical protein LX36DRAFT_686410 [Colletotrichum falcatum]
MASHLSPPFSVEHQLNLEFSEEKGHLLAHHLPGYPHIPLDDRRRIWNFLHEEFCSDDDPKLHLVWIYNRVFVKPLPRYVLSHSFWQRFLSYDSSRDTQCHRVHKAVLGYIRTYRYLEQFCYFAADLASIGDGDVSTQYCYREIRLTRLNSYAPLLLRKSYFQRVEYQYGAYIARFYRPILFWLGIASVVLSGLQVAVAVKEHQALSVFALRFSIAIMVFAGALLFLLVSLLIYKVAKEWRFTIQDRRRLLREKSKGHCLSP